MQKNYPSYCTPPGWGRSSYEGEERKRDMSFNCIYLKENEAYIGADSRITHSNGSYNDNFQKLFINRNLKLVWTMTGSTIYRNINYFQIINKIMNTPHASVLEKAQAIQDLMNPITLAIHKETNKDTFFDMFIVCIEDGQMVCYAVESKNGVCHERTNQKHWDTYVESSGVHTEMKNKITLTELEELSPKEMIHRIHTLIENVKEISSQDDKTVGGDSYIATIDNKGNIKTYINGKQQSFKIM